MSLEKDGIIVILSSPSGAGKTTLVKKIAQENNFIISISHTTRKPRTNEENGKDYYFLGIEGFQNKIKEDAFLEWEEVYENQYYGTLKSEIERVWSEGKTVIFDVDVIGGLNIKKQYPKECLSLFIMPPSVDVLRERLSGRGSESEAKLEMRLAKSEEEISKNQEFDKVILNDDFGIACEETMEVITNFINS